MHWRRNCDILIAKGGGFVRLYIKQRVFSWTDSYDVYDGFGAPRYEVRAEFLSLGH